MESYLLIATGAGSAFGMLFVLGAIAATVVAVGILLLVPVLLALSFGTATASAGLLAGTFLKKSNAQTPAEAQLSSRRRRRIRWGSLSAMGMAAAVGGVVLVLGGVAALVLIVVFKVLLNTSWT